MFTPRGTPTVLNFPKILSAIGAVSDQQNTMIKILAASRIVQDTLGIQLES